MEESLVLDDYILGLAGTKRPRICFVGTASGDNENYIVRFYRRFLYPCFPTLAVEKFPVAEWPFPEHSRRVPP